MTGQSNFLLAVLKALDKSGALEDIILIGSWCQYFYRIYFDYPHRIPAVRTMDVDFLIPNPPRIRKEINVPEILKKLDFVPAHDYPSGYTKYVHPELELDFLIPDLGRGGATSHTKYPDCTSTLLDSGILTCCSPVQWKLLTRELKSGCRNLQLMSCINL